MAVRRCGFLLLCVLACLATPGRGAGRPVFVVEDVGEGVRCGGANSLNDSGLAVGSREMRGVLWQKGHRTYIDAPAGYEGCVARGVNNRGQVVGQIGGFILRSDSLMPPGRAFLWEKGRIVELDGPVTKETFHAYSHASALNSKGQIVGGTGGPLQAVIWVAGKKRGLSPEAGTISSARDINEAGDVVGSFTVGDHHIMGSTDSHPCLWRNGQLQDLGTLGGPQGSAFCINNEGQIVGTADTASAKDQAFLWANGTMKNLGRLPGFSTSTAKAINDKGEIVGSCSKYRINALNQRDDEQRAVLWRHGRLTDLNTMIPANSGWSLESAVAINNRGQILGTGRWRGKPHAFLLTPVRNGAKP